MVFEVFFFGGGGGGVGVALAKCSTSDIKNLLLDFVTLLAKWLRNWFQNGCSKKLQTFKIQTFLKHIISRFRISNCFREISRFRNIMNTLIFSRNKLLFVKS